MGVLIPFEMSNQKKKRKFHYLSMPNISLEAQFNAEQHSQKQKFYRKS